MAAGDRISTRKTGRWDVPRIVEIERQCFPQPWDRDDFRAVLREPDGYCLVVQSEERIVGYAVYYLRKQQIELLNFGIEPTFRRQGFGRHLLGELTRKIDSRIRQAMVAVVRETNLPALAFLRACGFVAERLLKKHYLDTPEDAIAMYYRGPQVRRRFTWTK